MEPRQKKIQSGQTLIETMVAVFIMVMGITAALGLANYSLHASTSIRKQIIGIGLAREGQEAVKNIRDTNWLNGTLASDCYSYPTASSTGGSCYHDWLSPILGSGYNFGFGASVGNNVSKYYRLTFDGTTNSTNGFWKLTTVAAGTNAWGLDASVDPTKGFYTSTGLVASSSGFYRKITITTDTAAPFDKPSAGASDFPRLLVTSDVWWTDKNCPVSPDWPGPNKCSIRLQSYLTNWKNY